MVHKIPWSTFSMILKNKGEAVHVGRGLKIDLLGALSLLSRSWADVTKETI